MPVVMFQLQRILRKEKIVMFNSPICVFYVDLELSHAQNYIGTQTHSSFPNEEMLLLLKHSNSAIYSINSKSTIVETACGWVCYIPFCSLMTICKINLGRMVKIDCLLFINIKH